MDVRKYDFSQGDVKLSEHFKLSEFVCMNDSRQIQSYNVLVDRDLIALLEQLFDKLHCDYIIVTSGYRTPDYSEAIGGTRTDRHTRGQAADIICYRDGGIIPSQEVCIAAQELDIQGIGYISCRAVHIDSRTRQEHWWGDETTGRNVEDWNEYFED